MYIAIQNTKNAQKENLKVDLVNYSAKSFSEMPLLKLTTCFQSRFSQSQNVRIISVLPSWHLKSQHVCNPVFLSVEMSNKYRVMRWFQFESPWKLMRQEQKKLKPRGFVKNREPGTKARKTQLFQLFQTFRAANRKHIFHFQTFLQLELQQSLDSARSSTASPQGGVVELDPQQVPHAGLGRIVDDVLVVQERVSVAVTHPGLHAGAHRHRHAVSGGGKSERCQEALWLPSSFKQRGT